VDIRGCEAQFPVRPRMDDEHCPQEIWNGTTTRSPGATVVTSGPVCTTRATASCPNGYGPASG
jgi:hypothetical protein